MGKAGMRVVFRVDAAIEIGTGHVMRCLTLADALQDKGADCTFLCRPRDGNLIDFIAAQGHGAIALPALRSGFRGDLPPLARRAEPPHAHWLGTGWADDASDCVSALKHQAVAGSIDWLVVDHYALDERWERMLRPVCDRLMVIDDLADRPHDCDLLLDQNLGREPTDYKGLIPAATNTLLGPQYALLRPEFARQRSESLARRESPRLERVLVSMGGVDKDNATGHVLDVLDSAPLGKEVAITVVMGAKAPHLAQVRERAAKMRTKTEVFVGVKDMARLMTQSDLAIGAGGTTTWERCSLGLPAIQIPLVANQCAITEATSHARASIGTGLEMLSIALLDILEPKIQSERLADISRTAASLVDGSGTVRVLSALLESID